MIVRIKGFPQLSLGPLQDNGGPTLTMLPQPGTGPGLPASLATDNGDDVVCASATVGGVDQRGMLRPVGAGPGEFGR